MYIKDSTDWARCEDELRRKAKGLRYFSDIDRLVSNVRIKIRELSKAEVKSRQGQPHIASKLLIEVNSDIRVVEEYILVASLIG